MRRSPHSSRVDGFYFVYFKGGCALELSGWEDVHYYASEQKW